MRKKPEYLSQFSPRFNNALARLNEYRTTRDIIKDIVIDAIVILAIGSPFAVAAITFFMN